MTNFEISFNAWREWRAQWEREYLHMTSERMGQNFCNWFNLENPELFYCTDNNRAEEIIWAYVL